MTSDLMTVQIYYGTPYSCSHHRAPLVNSAIQVPGNQLAIMIVTGLT